jgi:hypothetical protein
LEIDGMNHLPDKGPVVVATNARGLEACLHVVSAADRATHFLFTEEEPSVRLPAWLRLAARRAALGRWTDGDAATNEQQLQQKIEQVLAHGGVVALSLNGDQMMERLLEGLAATKAPLLPVWYEPAPRPERKRRQRIYILGGRLLPAGSTMAEVEREWQRLAEELQQHAARGGPLQHVEFVGH